MNTNNKRLKYACYTANLSMSAVGNLSPLLFLTFRSLYGISYSMLGLLVLINFLSQLVIDLVFSFYAHKFNISKTVKIMPILTLLGLIVYALFPFFFPNSVYTGLVIGTVIFAISGGLSEVLISPVIAAIPSENPDREMSKLHSVYAWGVVFVVIISTLFLLVFGKASWQYLALLWVLIPLTSAILFLGADIPNMETPHEDNHALKLLFHKGFVLCFFCIFFGGASEGIMAQWSSSYLEQALSLKKVWGDVLGVAMFAVMLGLGRSLYAKYGKNINQVLFFGSFAAAICYITASLSNIPLVGLAACALTGLCVAMLWPGSLILASSKFPGAGLAVFALMAAGGDLGVSVGPQFVGIVTDAMIQNKQIVSYAAEAGIKAEQLAMKIGMLSAVIFPLMATLLNFIAWKSFPDTRKETNQGYSRLDKQNME